MNQIPESVLAPQLSSGEALLWSGMPRQGFFLRPSDVFHIPFGTMFFGFSIFWEYTAFAGGAPFFFLLWGIPFIVVGFYLFAGRFWLDICQRASTFYGLTEQRALIVTGLFGRQTKSMNLASLADVSLTEHANGRGTVMLGSGNSPFPFMNAGGCWPGMDRYAPPLFEQIEDARTVYNKIRELTKRG